MHFKEFQEFYFETNFTRRCPLTEVKRFYLSSYSREYLDFDWISRKREFLVDFDIRKQGPNLVLHFIFWKNFSNGFAGYGSLKVFEKLP